MGLNCGIVGLPNVGKSTLFNALTQSSLAEVANYPFCTIEPNTGKTIVRDARLKSLAAIANSEKTIYSQVEFVDIAGLVQGASAGEGLGNKFLGHIREVDAILHVLRCFEDGDVRHVHSNVDPVHDAEIVDMELMLADLESVKRRLTSMAKVANSDKDIKRRKDSLERVLVALENGHPARSVTEIDQQELHQLQLITSKPVMYVCNVEETSVTTGNRLSNAVKEMAEASGSKCCCLSAKLEAEIMNLEDEEMRNDFLREVGLPESGIDTAVRVMYSLLNLITFFTVGPKEARAWSIVKNTRADKAAGTIHTDFEKGFIKAETISFDDYVKYEGIAECKKAGKVRFEGRDYIVQDGDVIHFRVNK
ncbi:redox-regulated ATPase YchF [Candidatus Anaplasma sp. TIGMIC]|uniref:redox-regulated ATPase YchF n=1 Tax=Candidatus Anaplasma sp. TIGMIC TaxID=3020713 RepID=UPI0023310BCD|nr:redox-regulated ATPase YchF [Candidatus Anaplasma sp. TIGMIC]MDB1135298.1 redox-regulated ATPase YchF [Candidatus Anaplasma sp. TIGMIC]